MTKDEVHAANVALAYKYDAFNDPYIKELGLCPICLIKEGECFCCKKEEIGHKSKKPWWKRWLNLAT